MFSDNALILFQGDSITDGGRSRDEAPNHTLGHGYTYLLAARLGAEYPAKNWQFRNRGISGNRTPDLYARWREDTVKLRPAVLSILIGVNDIWAEYARGTGVSAEKYARVYRLLLEETRAELPETQLILMEPFALPVDKILLAPEYWARELPLRQQIVAELAAEFAAIFVPLQCEFDAAAKNVADPGYYICDGIHPTAAGHELIARAWMRALSGKFSQIS